MWSELTQIFLAAPENIYDKLFTCVSEDMKSRSIEWVVEPAQAEVCHVRHQRSTPLRAVEVEPPHVPFSVPETGVEGPAWFPFLFPFLELILQPGHRILATYDSNDDLVVIVVRR